MNAPTLATLPDFTAQQVYDFIVEAVYRQGRRSDLVNPEWKEHIEFGYSNGCAYRGDDGAKCPVGHVIDDDEYDPVMEGDHAEALIAVHCRSDLLQPRVLELLIASQSAHDGILDRRSDQFRSEWVHRMGVVAKQLKLAPWTPPA